jgi:hypothetical protein
MQYTRPRRVSRSVKICRGALATRVADGPRNRIVTLLTAAPIGRAAQHDQHESSQERPARRARQSTRRLPEMGVQPLPRAGKRMIGPCLTCAPLSRFSTLGTYPLARAAGRDDPRARQAGRPSHRIAHGEAGAPCRRNRRLAAIFRCVREDSNLHGPFSPQGPEPDTAAGVDGSNGVQRFQFARFAGRIGRVW